jgi:hypothetical protein
MPVYFTVIWHISWPLGIFYGHLVYCMATWYILWPFGNVVVIWYIFPRFGTLCQEKSGNPAPHSKLAPEADTRLKFFFARPKKNVRTMLSFVNPTVKWTSRLLLFPATISLRCCQIHHQENFSPFSPILPPKKFPSPPPPRESFISSLESRDRGCPRD